MEPFVLVGIVAVVVTVVKGRWRPALAVAVVGIALIAALVVTASGADEEDASVAQAAWLVGLMAWGVLALVVATRPALPGSAWDRSRATDPTGRPMRATQPLHRRLVRALLGAVVGVAPAVALMAVVLATADTGDEAQIAFVGFPLGLLGIGLGAWLGFTWVPRSTVADPVRSTASGTNRVEPGSRAGSQSADPDRLPPATTPDGAGRLRTPPRR